jgi:ferric-dicitrate binding protein FerR (iron transport regulator)
MSDPSTQPPEDDEDALARALTRGLHRQELGDEALARIRAELDTEFESITRKARRTRITRWVALAAGIAALSVLAVSTLRPREQGAVLATIERVNDGALEVRDGLLSHHTGKTGADLRVGERWVAQGPVLLTLVTGATLRVAAGTTLDATARDRVTLQSGRVYLDFDSGAAPFSLQTPAGAVDHIGTQFEAFVADGDTRIRVREGRVRISAPRGVEQGESGSEITVARSGEISRKSIPTYGKDWEWVESIAPTFAIDNKSLSDFLQWVARETGRHVDFADSHVRDVAAQIVLHGSVDGLMPLEALERVFSTTSLRFDLQGDVIRVSSRR